MTLLTFARGDTAVFSIALVNGDGDPLDLTSALLAFTAKRRYADDDADAIITKAIGSGIDVDADPTTGLATLTFEPEDTEELEDLRTLLWDLQVEIDNEVHTPLAGRLAVTPDVTREAPGS